jgi:predicted dehydrogenase
MRRPSTKSMQTRLTRRELLVGAGAAAAFTIVPRNVLGAAVGAVAPSESVNIGCVGVGGMQGGGDVNSISRCSGVNMVALCDVDSRQSGNSFSRFPNAKQYKDFREMLDKEKGLNGITVTIPDHMHATVSLWAMERGVGVYCQKPLTQTVWEARLLKNAAEKYKVATQMGNQGYSAVATRIACEMIWNDELGDITEVYSSNGSGFARGITEWPAKEDVPAGLDWDLWQGRAQEHTYSSKIVPSNWRGFLDYGTMMVGDWGIHQLGPANWALNLSNTHATSVTCTSVQGANPVTFPNYACVMEFPERPHPVKPGVKMPPVKIYWFEGSVSKQMAQAYKIPDGLTAADFSGFNEIFFGTKSCIGTGGRGESVGLIPRSRQTGYTMPPEKIKRSPGHYQDWVNALKGGDPACSNFSVAGPYAEWMLLGTISWRFPDEKLLWDGKNLRFTNNDKANEYVKPNFRKGWELKEITM